MPILGDATPPFADIIAGLISGLEAELSGVSSATIQVVEATPRPVGLSNLVGLDNPGGLQFAVIKGGRLEVGLRLDVLGANAASADAALLTAHSTLLDRRSRLRARGFLRFEPGTLTPTEELAGGFRRSGSYRALYEYRYRDVDGAASLIVRIPVDSDLDAPGGHEPSVITGSLVRWDREGQPTLRLRGPGRLQRLSALAYVPGAAPAVVVTLARTFTGATGAPAAVSSWADMAANEHSVLTFATLSGFLAEFGAASEEVELGDWDLDDVADRYALRTLVLASEIALPRSIDRLEISVQPAAGWVGHPAVLYLRTHGAKF